MSSSEPSMVVLRGRGVMFLIDAPLLSFDFCHASAYALHACSLRMYCDGDRLNSCCIRLTFLDTNWREHPLRRANSVSVGGWPIPNAIRIQRAWNSTSGTSDNCIAITTLRIMDSTSSWVYVR